MGPLSEVQPRLFTREELGRMIDAGIFDKDEHLELLHGRLVVAPPQGLAHSYVSTILRDRLMRVFTQGLVREAKPLDCGATVPEPDIAVVQGNAATYEKRDPRGDESSLVIEVSRTTQKTDRDKAPIYADGGVPVYWLVDVTARRSKPTPSPAAIATAWSRSSARTRRSKSPARANAGA
jgi:Uma2 family endonuclease